MLTDSTGGPPPKKTPAVKAPVAVKASPLTAKRADALNGFGQLAQVPLLALKQYADAGAVSLYWPNVAGEIAKLAETQDQIAKLVDPLIQIGPYTGLITAILPFALQIAVNHGRVTPGAMGTVPKDSLAAQVEANLANVELQALQAQLEAEKASAAVRAEIQQQRTALADAMRDVQVEATGGHNV